MSKSKYVHPVALSLARGFAEAEGFTLAFICGPLRHKGATRARQAVIWNLARSTDATLPEIAAVVCKDHTSVIHAIRAENERRGTDVRGMQFPAGYHERHRIAALVSNELSREVMA